MGSKSYTLSVRSSDVQPTCGEREPCEGINGALDELLRPGTSKSDAERVKGRLLRLKFCKNPLRLSLDGVQASFPAQPRSSQRSFDAVQKWSGDAGDSKEFLGYRQLQAYTEQVGELAAMEERNRLARELHDSVSQTMFSIVLNIRSTQILLERDPARIRPQLEQLKKLTQSVLTDMRSLISKLRPKDD